MKASVYNLQGQVAKELELSDTVFNIPIKQEVVHEVYVAQMNNQREPWAHSKNRGEVSGGGKKPWKQKGTGRARHGSIRSPIWKGGGVAFGPLSVRNYTTKINKKTRRLALKMCLSDKLKNGTLWIVEDFNFEQPKTKLFAEFLKKLPAKQKSFLVLTPAAGSAAAVVRMTKNIPRIQTQTAAQVSVMDMLSKQAVIVSTEGVKKIEELLSK
jgi:large subunit ribosomal protein L4